MRQTLRLKRGMYVLFDSYKRPFLYHMRPKASPTTVIFLAFSFVLSLTYAFTAPYASSDAPTDQPVTQAEGRSSSNR
jgi:hypothetical protein